MKKFGGSGGVQIRRGNEKRNWELKIFHRNENVSFQEVARRIKGGSGE